MSGKKSKQNVINLLLLEKSSGLWYNVKCIMNNYVISDIHGNAERLSALLDILKKKHPKGNFTLHIIGDLFDRGENSADVFKIVKNNHKNIKALLGNHEDLFMDFMESPVINYPRWQMNFSYPTIISFLTEEFKGFVYANKIKLKDLATEFYAKRRKTESKLKKITKIPSENLIKTYIGTIVSTISERDMRSPKHYFDSLINAVYPNLPAKEKIFIKNICYIGLVDKFCEIYEYLSKLSIYSEVNGNYLLVHSGFVSKNEDRNQYDTCENDFYNECKNINDIKSQSKFPLLWSRRYETFTEKPVAPKERFDNHIIVYGHSATDRFNTDKSLLPHFEYDKVGRLVSIGLDGKNCDMANGELNCLNLEDLSQIIVLGSNEKHEKNYIVPPMTYTIIPYKNSFENESKQKQ